MGKRRRKSSGAGRFFEGMAVLILILVVLTFGISIASRYMPEGGDEPMMGMDPRPNQGGAPAPRLVSAPPAAKMMPANRPALEIANGCGVPGLADRVRFELQGPEFDVVECGNADNYDYQETLVIAGAGDRAAAEAVCALLQQRYAVGRVELRGRPSSLAEIRVILGRDFAKASQEKKPGTGLR